MNEEDEPDWPRIAAAFARDGSLRDVYVLDASLDDWALVWPWLRDQADRLTFRVDLEPSVPPVNVEEVFRLRHTRTVDAALRLGGQTLRCHFFLEDEVEFDLDPSDVDSPAAAGQLSLFLTQLGRLLGKEVRLTAENARDAVIARYDPADGRVRWLRA